MKEHVICHLKPSMEASPQAYNSEMSDFLSVPRMEMDGEALEAEAEEPDPGEQRCQWCCHALPGRPVGAPLRKTGDALVVTGQYCSPSCAAAAIFDQHADSNSAWTRYQLLNDSCSETVVRAPPRVALRMFGGTMNIQEFRSGASTVIARLPPVTVEKARLEEVPSHYLYRDIYTPLDEQRVSQYKERLSRQRPKTSFFIQPAYT